MKDIFKNIGLNDLETNVYVELIKIGPQVASTIANRLHINRSNIYSVLRSLFLKGLITYFQKDKVKVLDENISFLDDQTLKLTNQNEVLNKKIVDKYMFFLLYCKNEGLQNEIIQSQFFYSSLTHKYNKNLKVHRLFLVFDQV